mmetsp:Transcript_11732/g.26904  ORF Transcript_11732/g.26904 Transcript_11732/m.26904 type:complete len:209 (+) Transcript_11732:2321-2947(+)
MSVLRRDASSCDDLSFDSSWLILSLAAVSSSLSAFMSPSSFCFEDRRDSTSAAASELCFCSLDCSSSMNLLCCSARASFFWMAEFSSSALADSFFALSFTSDSSCSMFFLTLSSSPLSFDVSSSSSFLCEATARSSSFFKSFSLSCRSDIWLCACCNLVVTSSTADALCFFSLSSSYLRFLSSSSFSEIVFSNWLVECWAISPAAIGI